MKRPPPRIELITDEEYTGQPPIGELRFPNMRNNRVEIAAGEDAQTGTRKLDELLERIRNGEEPPLTAVETGSLLDIDKFKRRRGQSEKREYCRRITDEAVALYHELRR